MRRGALPHLVVVRSDRLPGPLLSPSGLDSLSPRAARVVASGLGGAGGADSDGPLLLDDPVELLTEPAGPDAMLLVDADRMASSDVGLLVRWIEAGEGRRLALVGSEPSIERLRVAGAPIDEVLDWPLPDRRSAPREADLSEIEAILGAGNGPGTNGHGRNGSAAHGNGNGHAPDRGQARISARFAPRPGSAPRSAFLRSPIQPPSRPAAPAPMDPAPAQPWETEAHRPDAELQPLGLDPQEPLLTAEELDAFFQPMEELSAVELEDVDPGTGLHPEEGLLEPEPEESEPDAAALELDLDSEPEHELDAPTGRATAAPRPPWLKRQIADLADMVQALELRARSNHAHVGMESELARLRQFCKTLGLVASPPAHRAQRFDLAVHVEEQLGQLAGSSPDSPRILFRTRGDDPSIDADKGLVACAVDAVLQTSLACGHSGDVVRVQVVGDGPTVALDVEFPPGPLTGRAPSEVLEPYAVRDVLPQIGANALAAAGAIAVGQGGDLQLEEREGGALAFRLELVRAEEDSLLEGA